MQGSQKFVGTLHVARSPFGRGRVANHLETRYSPPLIPCQISSLDQAVLAYV